MAMENHHFQEVTIHYKWAPVYTSLELSDGVEMWEGAVSLQKCGGAGWSNAKQHTFPHSIV